MNCQQYDEGNYADNYYKLATRDDLKAPVINMYTGSQQCQGMQSEF